MIDKKNKEYYTEKDFINSTRLLTLMSALLFFAFAVVDVWAIPSALTEALIARGGAITILLVVYFMTFTRHFYPLKNMIMPGVIVFSAMAIEYMIFIASPNDQAYSVYYVGIVLILMTLYSLTYINFTTAIILSFIIISGYIGIELFTRPMGLELAATELLTNLFFIFSAVILGMVARSIRDKYMLENYHLHESLSAALKEKIIEANNYEYQANHDALTLLPNRRYMTQLLEKALLVAKEKNKILAILFFDLNGFKQINDVYGHAVGDEVLAIVAKRLKLAVRKDDCIARLGGDEYLVGLLMDKGDVSTIEAVADKFVQIISEPMNIDGNLLEVGASIGIAAYPMHGDKAEVLIDIADKKMYSVKNKTSNKKNTPPDPKRWVRARGIIPRAVNS